MSQVVAFESVASGRAPRGHGALVRILLGAVAISAVAGVAAVTLLDGLVHPNEVPRLAPAPSTQGSLAGAPAAVAATAGHTTVPDAAAVFAGREVTVEEPAPTF
jgi:hypothetical protein